MLAPYDNEQSDLLHRIKKDCQKLLEEMPIFHDLVKVFVTQELIVLREFTDKFRCALIDGTEAEPATGVFEQFPNYWQDMSKRIIEHNIRTVSHYYSRIRLQRLSELLSLTTDEIEEYLSNLVTKKTIFARIDRPEGVVTFRETKDAADVLNEWSRNLNSLMSLVNKATHLVHKEEMVHGILR